MSQPIIEVNGISKRYHLGEYGFSSFREETEKWWRRLRGQPVETESTRDFWALRDISFTVQPGEVVGIIGRNGAGKSTLLKILSRITEPTAGEVVLRGRVASLLEVGTGFHPELSGRENIFLNGAILGMTKAEIARKFDEIVAFAEVDQFIDTPVKRYSSGMYVRLAFAVAAHLDPEILIVDEVLAVGDVQFQQKCLGKMQDVARETGRTVLFVSHNLGAVSSLTQKCAYLKSGRLVAYENTPAVIQRYASDYQHTASEWNAAAENQHPIQITRMRLLTTAGDDAGTFELSDGLQIAVEYVVRRPMRDTVMEVWIYSSEGVKVAVIGDYDTHPALRQLRQPGRYRACFTLPGNLLNLGTYNVKLNSCEQGMHTYDFQDAGAFSIVENRRMSPQARRGGLLAVLPRCHHEMIGR